MHQIPQYNFSIMSSTGWAQPKTQSEPNSLKLVTAKLDTFAEEYTLHLEYSLWQVTILPLRAKTTHTRIPYPCVTSMRSHAYYAEKQSNS